MNLRDRFNSVIKGVARQGVMAAVDRPLLNDTELQLLQQAALAAHDNPFLINLDVQHQLLGERTSSFAGSGYEFAGHRRYVAGDDMRFINWRAMARTGKMYRKVFHEERRPQLYLVVDRRAPMRFGTRLQLKVTSAVRQAVQLLYQARQQQLLTGSVILEDKANWIKASQGATDVHTIIQQLNRSCPPLPLMAPSLVLDAVLNELAVRLTPGCIIYLLSDFHDLGESSRSILYHLAQQHKLYARHILDPAELELPEDGRYPLYDEQDNTLIDIDPANEKLKKQFAEAMQQRQHAIQTLIQQSGGEYRLVMTDGSGHG